MAAALEETPVTYEELAEIEREFDDVETEIIRQQVKLTRPLYERRQATVSQIPNFWPLVIEQAPPDIDQYIQPFDSALLLSSLTSLWVSHFEIEDEAATATTTSQAQQQQQQQQQIQQDGGIIKEATSTGTAGDPRSVAIRWEFSENEYFEDRILEKRFWYRRARDGWAGLVSEPVDIRWKKGKDLTHGLLGLVKRVWDEEQLQQQKREGGADKKKKMAMTAERRALKKKLENTSIGSLSFFAWFGYVGRRVSAEESRLATEREREKRRRRGGDGQDGQEDEEDSEDDDDDEEKEEEEEEEDLEIFPDGDSLAVTITDDLWPGAIKYFTQAQEQDALSDDDFESDEEGDEDEEVEGDEEMDGADPHLASPVQRPAKKRKA